MQPDRWLLPDGVEEVLPPESWQLEAARRRLLDLYWRWGYDLIRPPLIEYLDSLLTGAGQNLGLQTFKLTDQLSGRMLGARSDMTTQAARIDAHRLPTQRTARYCYIGSVLRARADEVGGSRSPLQIGVELFGHAGRAADLEVMSLMQETLREMGVASPYLDIGHVALYRVLVEKSGIEAQAEQRLFDIMQRKSAPDLQAMIKSGELSATAGAWFARLMDLHGDTSVLSEAQEALGGLDARIDAALAELTVLVEQQRRHYPDVAVHIDLAELHGYGYKTGFVFAAFAPGLGRELARGGRYDNVGRAFGRARPATGFSADLNVLTALGDAPARTDDAAVFAPPGDDPELLSAIRGLRAQGRRVVVGLPDESGRATVHDCAEELVCREGHWQCVAVTCEDH